MASDSREDSTVVSDVPVELDEWLNERAAYMGVEREVLIRQVLASYHAAATLDGELDAAQFLELNADDFVDIESAVSAEVDTQVQSALTDRIANLESEFQAKLADVRERVIQVKRETDSKAPADHEHREFDAIEALDERIAAIARDFESLDDELDERFDSVNEKLDRVAWVVSDLKEDANGRSAHEQAVDRLKSAAAEVGVSTATCERCDSTVHVALLTDPRCPHCETTVSDVRPTGGLFRKKARLVPASQLESGAEDDA